LAKVGETFQPTEDWTYGDLKAESKTLYQQIINEGKCSSKGNEMNDLVSKLREYKKDWKEKETFA